MKNLNLKDIKHNVYAFLIVILVSIALKFGAKWDSFECSLIGVCASEAALFGKVIWDRVHGILTFDLRDIKICQIGVVIGFLCAWIFI